MVIGGCGKDEKEFKLREMKGKGEEVVVGIRGDEVVKVGVSEFEGKEKGRVNGE